jgi:hypothetical protein
VRGCRIYPPLGTPSAIVGDRNAGLFAEINDFRKAGFCAIVAATTTA